MVKIHKLPFESNITVVVRDPISVMETINDNSNNNNSKLKSDGSLQLLNKPTDIFQSNPLSIITKQLFLDSIAIDTDIVFLCCSQNAENFVMIDAHFLSKLKPGCIIINVARVSNSRDINAANINQN